MRRAVVPMTLLLVLGVLLVGFSASAGEIKARMKKRLPVITALKAKGLVGENNRGFLEFLTDQRPHRAEVEAENRDRLTVYTIIAERQQTSPELVGRQRAAQIARKEPPGNWVQDAGGQWRRVR